MKLTTLAKLTVTAGILLLLPRRSSRQSVPAIPMPAQPTSPTDNSKMRQCGNEKLNK